MAEPIALTDGYSPTILFAGHGPGNAALHRAEHRLFVYALLCWSGANMRVGTRKNALVELPKHGIWMSAPGERLLFHAAGPCRTGWIHCRATSINPWHKRRPCYCFHVEHPDSEPLLEPTPVAIWGMDLRHAPPNQIAPWASRTCFEMIQQWEDHTDDDLIEANGSLATIFHRWRQELRKSNRKAKHIPDMLALEPEDAMRWYSKRVIRKAGMDVTVENIADEMHVTPSSLTRIFRRANMSTPGRQLRERRLQSAANQLRTTRRTVEQIAKSCGYANATSFRRAFKKAFGMPPRAFRHTKPGKGPAGWEKRAAAK